MASLSHAKPLSQYRPEKKNAETRLQPIGRPTCGEGDGPACTQVNFGQESDGASTRCLRRPEGWPRTGRNDDAGAAEGKC
jgi:hypothetical protein